MSLSWCAQEASSALKRAGFSKKNKAWTVSAQPQNMGPVRNEIYARLGRKPPCRTYVS